MTSRVTSSIAATRLAETPATRDDPLALPVADTAGLPRPLRVLHVIYMLSEDLGGPPRALATLARAQAARGDDVTVLPCRRGAGPQTLEVGRHGSLAVHAAPTDARLMWYNGLVRRTVLDLAQTADIVHVHGTWRYHLLAAAGAAPRGREQPGGELPR